MQTKLIIPVVLFSMLGILSCNESVDGLFIRTEGEPASSSVLGLRSSNEVSISTFDPSFQDPGQEWDDVKVYFQNPPGVACYVKVIASDGNFYNPVGDYIFNPNSTDAIRSMQPDVTSLCTGSNYGYITKNITFEIEGIYRLDNSNEITYIDIGVASSTGTIGAQCNENDGDDGGGSFGG